MLHLTKYAHIIKNKKDKKETIEGEKTANAAVLISKKYQLDLPIIKTVNKLIIEDVDTKEAIKKLLERPLKKEYSSISIMIWLKGSFHTNTNVFSLIFL